jgi:hypothetical protein
LVVALLRQLRRVLHCLTIRPKLIKIKKKKRKEERKERNEMKRNEMT